MEEVFVPELEELPGSLRRIADHCGIEAVAALLTIPGERIWVPKRVSAEHFLVGLLGQAAAVKLVANFGGEVLFVPRAALARLRRRRDIQRDSSTLTVRELAIKYGVSERLVYQFLSSAAVEVPEHFADLQSGPADIATKKLDE